MFSKVRKNHHKNITLNIDYFRPHTFRKPREYMSPHIMKRTIYNLYSLDINLSDIYLFGNIKDNLKQWKFKSYDEHVLAIHEILYKIGKDQRISVFHDRKERLKHLIDTNIDYY